MLSLLPSLAAVALLPHARMNFGCQPLWDDEKARYRVQIGEEVVDFPYELPGSTSGQPCGTCVQRIWCTTSGAFGYYDAETETRPAMLYFTWAGREDKTPVEVPLRIAYRGEELNSTSTYEQGTVLVIGNTLYYYAYSVDSEGSQRLPVLDSITFSQYDPDIAIEELYTYGTAADILRVPSGIDFSSQYTAIYTPAPEAITVSIAAENNNSIVAVDVLLTNIDRRAPLRTRILMPRQFTLSGSQVTVPAITTATRQFITLPNYTCGVFTAGKPYCHMFTLNANWTWGAAQSVAGIQFSRLEGGFELPFSFWQPASLSSPALVATGFTPVLTALGDALVALHETEDSQLALAYYAISDTGVTLLRSQSTPKPSLTEPEPAAAVPFSALAVKWTGPYTEQFSVFIAQDLATGNYTAVDEQLCPVTQHMSTDGCADCSAGHSCNGITETACPGGTWAAPGSDACEQCSAGSYSSAKSENCTPCGPGTYSRVDGSSQCTVCNNYMVAPKNGNLMCVLCGLGMFPTSEDDPLEDPVETGAAYCTLCPAGSYCPTGVDKKSCPGGFYQENDGYSYCDVCPSGYWCENGAQRPQKCDLPLGEGAAECESCGRRSAWLNGSCVSCDNLPQGLSCRSWGGVYRIYRKKEYNTWAIVGYIGLGVLGCFLVFLVVKCCIKRPAQSTETDTSDLPQDTKAEKSATTTTTTTSTTTSTGTRSTTSTRSYNQSSYSHYRPHYRSRSSSSRRSTTRRSHRSTPRML